MVVSVNYIRTNQIERTIREVVGEFEVQIDNSLKNKSFEQAIRVNLNFEKYPHGLMPKVIERIVEIYSAPSVGWTISVSHDTATRAVLMFSGHLEKNKSSQNNPNSQQDNSGGNNSTFINNLG